MASYSTEDCFNDPCGTADKIFGKLKGVGGKVNVRQPNRPAKQNSADALNIPRRRALAAEGEDAFLNSPLISGGVNELTNATVGTGRRLKPQPNQKRLGWTSEQYTEFVEDAKCLFNEHMYSKRKWIDQEGDQTLGEMQRTILEQTISVGETYTLGFQFTNPERPFRTALSIIHNDRVRDPDDITEEERKRTIAGHLKGPSGRTNLYFVHDYHRCDPRNQDSPQKYSRIRRYNEFGREQVIHTYVKKLPGLTRGLSHLTSAFGKLKCFEQYEKVRMEAAIMQTAMAFVIKSSDKNILEQIAGNGMAVNDDMLKKIHALSMKKMAESQQYYNGANLEIDGVKGIRLLPDEEAQLLSGGESGVNDKQFVDECLSQIARATGLSRATLTQDFETSYSAARATLISFYRQCEIYGDLIVDDWLRSVYAMWLEDVIQTGKLVIPGFPDPTDAWMHFILNREWYCGSQFVGPERSQIDQSKEMAYWTSRKKIGAFTLQEFYDSKAKDWQTEICQQIEELKFIDMKLDGLDLKHIPNPLAYLMTDIATIINVPTVEAETDGEE